MTELLKWYNGSHQQPWIVCIEEAVTNRCSMKKVFLEISQNSLENTCVKVSFLLKLEASGLQFY